MATFTITAANSILATGTTLGLLDNNASNIIFIAAGGSIIQTGTADALRFAATSGTHSLVIDGALRSTGGAALQLAAAADVVVGNNGIVSSQQISVLTSGNLKLNNGGTISGLVAIEAAGNFGDITNSGNIFSTSSSLAAIRFTGSPVVTSQNVVSNTGLISGASGFAIEAGINAVSLLVTNSGTILGGISLVQSSVTDDRVINSGLISGTISLGGGADTYDARGGGRFIGTVDLGLGNDSFFGSAFDETVATSAGDDSFSLGGGDDTVTALAGDGNDTLQGGAGADTYDASTLTAAITVNLATGVANGSAIGNDIVTGFENVNGTFGNDTLVGNSSGNILDGGNGADVLDGRGSGDDILDGGFGNETYIIDAGDTIRDSSGIDLVQSSTVNLDLTALADGAIEKAALLGTAALSLTGNGLANTLTGNSGNNTLTGNGGADQLRGEAGNDTYVIDAADVIVETAGIDTVVSSAVSINLVTRSAGKLENVTLTGTAALFADGNAAANTLTGNDGLNRLKGKDGNDILTGGAAKDTFIFDTALNGVSNVDRITDFDVPDDIIQLENTGSGLFTGLANGVLAASRFAANDTGVARDADDRIVYNTTTGDVFFDSNGNGAGGAIKFATIVNKAALTSADFFII